jgi:glucosamine-6-phosphate deaminase
LSRKVNMQVKTYIDSKTMSRAAARHAGQAMRQAISARGSARIIAATGTSQIAFLDALSAMQEVDWAHVEMFHLDEYVGLPYRHPASFRRYLHERLIDKTRIARYHLLDGGQDWARTVERIGRELATAPIDVAFVGIGENGHLAFNDPPADFETEAPYLIVTLDDACRHQQVGEGWFASAAEVPAQAITMSVRQILKSREIICVVPDRRKARAVKGCLEGEISPMMPASILRTHAKTTLYLDPESAALISDTSRGPIFETDQS